MLRTVPKTRGLLVHLQALLHPLHQVLVILSTVPKIAILRDHSKNTQSSVAFLKHKMIGPIPNKQTAILRTIPKTRGIRGLS
jgi:hypothetical protein